MMLREITNILWQNTHSPFNETSSCHHRKYFNSLQLGLMAQAQGPGFPSLLLPLGPKFPTFTFSWPNCQSKTPLPCNLSKCPLSCQPVDTNRFPANTSTKASTWAALRVPQIGNCVKNLTSHFTEVHAAGMRINSCSTSSQT